MIRVEIEVDDRGRFWVSESANDPEAGNSSKQAAKNVDDALNQARGILTRSSDRGEREFEKGFEKVRPPMEEAQP